MDIKKNQQVWPISFLEERRIGITKEKGKRKTKASVNEELAQELHKPVVTKFQRMRICRDSKIILGHQICLKGDHDLLRIAVLKLLCVRGFFTKNVQVKPLQDKKVKTVLNGFIKIVNKPNRRPNKFWTDKWLPLNLHQKLVRRNTCYCFCNKKNPWTCRIKDLNG